MPIDAQQLVNGLAVGSLYAALGLALVIIFRATEILNFAQGELATLGAYLAWTFIVPLAMPFWVGFVGSLVISFVIGAGIERLIMRRVEHAPQLAAVMVTFGIFLVVNATTLALWGGIPKSFPGPFGGGAIELGDLFIGRQYLGTLVVTLLVMAGVFLFFRFTELGLGMRAATSNVTAARLMGVNAERMRMLGWGISSAIGAAAGIFIANLTTLSPNMTGGVLIYAFAAVVLGGITSPFGVVVAGLVLGVVESIAGTTQFIGSEFKTPFAFLVFVVIILIRPAGLFGRSGAQSRA